MSDPTPADIAAEIVHAAASAIQLAYGAATEHQARRAASAAILVVAKHIGQDAQAFYELAHLIGEQK